MRKDEVAQLSYQLNSWIYHYVTYERPLTIWGFLLGRLLGKG